MSNKTNHGAYNAPECEMSETLIKELLCESPTGSTEEFGTIDDFTW